MHPVVLEKQAQKDAGEAQQLTLTPFIQSQCPKKYAATDQRQKQITSKLIDYVAETLQPLSTVEAPSFISMIEALNPQYQVPSRKHLSSKLIADRTAQLQKSLCNAMSNASHISLTLDLWTNRQMRSYLGITAHFINDFQFVSCMLSCKRFKGRHTAENIYSSYENIVQQFEIEKKVKYIVSDNASNMIKAFSLPGFEESTTGDALLDSDNETDNEDDDDTTTGSTTDPSTIDEDVFEYLPEHQSCFAHTLQLVVKDGMKDIGSLHKVINKASSIVSHIKKSIHASEFLEDLKRVQASNVTRWNSEVKMIRSVLNIPADKLDQLDTQKLTHHDRSLLTDLLEILSPFEEATDVIQKQNTTSASFIVPCIRGLKSVLSNTHSKFQSKLVSTLRSSVNKRLSSYYEQRMYLIIAAILDPRFKLRWCASESEEYKMFYSALLNKATITASEDSQDIMQQTNLSDQAQDEEGHLPPSKKKKPLNLFKFMDNTDTQVSTSSAETEVKDYLSTPCSPHDTNILQYWKQQQTGYPCLTKLALQYLVVPASSAPVERLFSIGGKIFRPDRCRLTDETFECLIFIKNNAQFCK